jgi:hypothetical protein
VSALDEIVDRAIEYTNLILRRMPSYRDAALEGLRKLRESLAAKAPDDPAIGKLDAFLSDLDGRDQDGSP